MNAKINAKQTMMVVTVRKITLVFWFMRFLLAL